MPLSPIYLFLTLLYHLIETIKLGGLMLKIFFNTVDKSSELENYLLDPVTFTFNDYDEISVGYYKPINSVFMELNQKNTEESKLQVYYYNGTSFISTTVKDETKGMSRSGFLKWGRNLENEVKSTVNGVEAYWYKLKVDVATSELILAGINLVFSSDLDLTEEYPSIMEYLPENKISFINFHVASRKDILSYFRTQGKLITDSNSSESIASTKLVDQFDLLNYEEVRDASKFLTLAKIFYWVSDAVDDKWYQKAKGFEAKYGEKISLVNLSLDSNDDGKADATEVNAVQFVTIVRQ